MFLVLASVFLVIGALIHKFKFYSLLAGYNTMSSEEQNNIDKKRMGKIVGYHMYILSIVFVILSFFVDKFPNVEFLVPLIILGIIGHMIYKLNKGDMYIDKEMARENKKNDKPTKIAIIFLVAIPILIAVFVTFTSMKPTDIKIENNSVIVGTANIPINEIDEVKLLNEMPKSNKVFGFGMGAYKKGTFNVEGYGDANVQTQNQGKTLYIETNTKKYFINTGNDASIDSIYEKLKK